MMQFLCPKKALNFTGKFPLGVVLAATIALGSIACLLGIGVNWGIDFLGGTEMQVQFAQGTGGANEASTQAVRQVLETMGLDKHQVQRYGQANAAARELLIRVQRQADLNEADLQKLQQLVHKRFSTGGDADKTIAVRQSPNAADRLFVTLPRPAQKQHTTPQARQKALVAQHDALIQLLLSYTPLQLRTRGEQKPAEAAVNSVVQEDHPHSQYVLYTVQTAGIAERIRQTLSARFGAVEVRRVEFVDSQVSRQLRTDGLLAVIYALLAILIYIAVRFDLLFAPGAIIALVHDTLGAFLIFTLGGMEFNLPSVAALLTIVGYSINNTIVVYDRIREAIPPESRSTLSSSELVAHVNQALTDTLSRTLNTSLTTLFASVSLWVLGTGAICTFAAALSVGIVLGGFSTTFVAPAVYLWMQQRSLQSEAARAQSGAAAQSQQDKGPSREEKLRGIV